MQLFIHLLVFCLGQTWALGALGPGEAAPAALPVFSGPTIRANEDFSIPFARHVGA